MNRRCAGLLTMLAVAGSLYAAPSFGFSLRHVPSSALRNTSPAAEGIPFDGYAPAEGSTEAAPPSTSRAVMYSLLLPGLGQYALGEERSAWTFFIAEGAIWTSFVVFEVQAHLRRESYKEYALVFAGISTTDHSDDFFREIGDYDSSEDYELYIKRDARAYTYPNSDYATLEDYFVQNRMSDFESWAWRSTEDREQYYSIRWGSRLASRRALYSLAAALGNRVISAVLALRSSRSAGDETAAAGGHYLHVYLDSRPDPAGNAQLGISLARDF